MMSFHVQYEENSIVRVQAFPKIYQAVVKASDVLRLLTTSSSSGDGLVDMSNLAGRITAGRH